MSISTMTICRATSIRNAPKGDRIKVLRYHMGLRFSSSKRLCTMTLFQNMCIRCVKEPHYGRVYELSAASCRDTMFMAVPILFQDWGAFSNMEYGSSLLQTVCTTRLITMWRPAPIRCQCGGSKMPLVPHEGHYAVF